MQSTFVKWLAGFRPHPTVVRGREQFRVCVGALLGIVITGAVSYWLFGPASYLPMIVAPIGASAVLLFGVPSSPLAQPWSILGGNTLSALVGISCMQLQIPLLVAAGLAIAGAIAAMFALRCLHPPGGAVALTTVLGGAAVHAQGYHFALMPVALNSALLLLVALAYNNATRHRYPHAATHVQEHPHHTSDKPATARIGFTPEDLDYVLKQYNEVLDVSRDELEKLLQQAELHAYRRKMGEICCADIMSADVICVEFGTPLDEAWSLLQHHRIKAMPVIDRARRVIGIITQTDFMRHAELASYRGIAHKLRQLIQPSASVHSDKPEVVGQIMSKQVKTASVDDHLVQIVPLLSDKGMHHVPVIDAQRRIAGIITQSDLVAALCRSQTVVAAPAADRVEAWK